MGVERDDSVLVSRLRSAVRPLLARPGFSAVVVLTLKVQEGWHVYANPTGVAAIPPTRVSLDPASGWAVERVEYPPGVARVLGSSGPEKVALYEGQVPITVHLKAAPGAAGGRPEPPSRVVLTVQYQACNDRLCLAPARVSVPVTWAPGG